MKFASVLQKGVSMQPKFIIYDPPMCCSSGVCGPNPDQTLINFEDTLVKVKKLGVEIERHVITQSPEKFKKNPQVIKLIQEQQLNILPITSLNGEIIKTGSYPTLEEFKNFIKKK